MAKYTLDDDDIQNLDSYDQTDYNFGLLRFNVEANQQIRDASSSFTAVIQYCMSLDAKGILDMFSSPVKFIHGIFSILVLLNTCALGGGFLVILLLVICIIVEIILLFIFSSNEDKKGFVNFIIVNKMHNIVRVQIMFYVLFYCTICFVLVIGLMFIIFRLETVIVNTGQLLPTDDD